MSSRKSSVGIGFSGVLFVVFLVLRLTDNIDWSWWWVTSPLWIPLTIFVAVSSVALLIAGLIDSIKGKL